MTSRATLPTLAMIALLIQPAAGQVADAHNRREALQYYRAGMEFMSAEQFDKAADQFSKAIGKDRLLTMAHFELGRAYMALHRYASASKAYRDCIEAYRQLFELQQRSYFQAEKERDDQIREMEDTIRRMRAVGRNLQATTLEKRVTELRNQGTSIRGVFQPPAEVLLGLGSADFRNGDVVAAEAEWKAAIAVDPNLGEAHNNLAVIHMRAGRYTEAEQEINTAEKHGFRVNPQFKDDVKAAQGR
jgi:Tfp pilus assembly protein PilF